MSVEIKYQKVHNDENAVYNNDNKNKISSISKMCFFWMNDILNLANTTDLKQEDITKRDEMSLPLECTCLFNGSLLQAQWKDNKKSLFSSIIFLYTREFAMIGLILLATSLLAFIGPVFLKILTSCASNPEKNFYIITLYILLLFFAKLIGAIMAAQFNFRVNNISISIRCGIKYCLFQKLMTISASSKRNSVGNMTNIYTVDVDRIVACVISLHNLWIMPLQIFLACYLLFDVVSYAMFVGLGSIVIILIVNNYISILQKQKVDLMMKYKDQRMKTTSEVFASMLTIKLHNLESKFYSLIISSRTEELIHIWGLLLVSAFNIFLLWLAPQFVSSTTISYFAIYMNGEVTAVKIFTALSLFKMLQQPLRNLPQVISQFYQALSSIQRIQKFYVMKDKEEIEVSELINNVNRKLGSVTINNVNFRWNDNDVCNDDIILDNNNIVDDDDDDDNDDDDSIYNQFKNLFKSNNNRTKQSYEKLSDQMNEFSVSNPLNEITSKKLRKSNHIHKIKSKSLAKQSLELSKLCINKSISTLCCGGLKDLKEDEEDGNNNNSNENINFRLKIKNLKILPSKLVVVKGLVGVGKTAFIMSLLREMYINNCSDNNSTKNNSQKHFQPCKGSIAFVSQQPWIQNMSLRENITFGLPFIAKKYAKVICAVCLDQDFKEFPFGDQTIIGERGLNISGGQKARVALARAVYSDSDIIIFDDVLAALDAIVAKKVYEKCIVNLLCQKTRILVTHNTDIINSNAVDMLISIESSGQVNILNKKTKIIDLSNTNTNAVEIDNSDVDSNVLNILSIEESPITIDNKENIEQIEEMCNKEIHFNSQENEEDRAKGRVSKEVYVSYINAMGGYRPLIFLCLVQFVWQALSISSDLFLSHWTQEDEMEQYENLYYNVSVFCVLSMSSGFIVLVRTLTVSTLGYRAAKILFEDMLKSLLYAPMGWLDINPSGRLLNRMSDDQNKVDSMLPFAVGSVFSTLFAFAGDMLTVTIITRYLIFMMLPIFLIYFWVMSRYLNASREIQRLISITQSPALTYMTECSAGIFVLRSFGEETINRIVNKNVNLIDLNSQMVYIMNACTSWFVFRTEILGDVILLCITTLVFLGSSYLTPGMVGLSISYGLSISSSLQSLVFILSWFENSMVCPERIQQYAKIQSEGTDSEKRKYWDKDNDEIEIFENTPIDDVENCDVEMGNLSKKFNSSSFQVKGEIIFENVNFRYQPNKGDLVLRDLSFKINAKEKIGVVGRTGSGKSSLSMSLFRIAELTKGRILIDGVDISSLSLSSLRSSIEICPQCPVIFKGTLRNYLDPFEEFTDEDIIKSLIKSQFSDIMCKVVEIEEEKIRSRNNSVVRSRTNSVISSTNDSASVGDYSNENTNSIPQKNNSIERVVRNDNLNDPIFKKMINFKLEENGNNLSVGERQMLVLARVLLRGAKIFIMDEATASVDQETDQRMQQVLINEFKDSTLLIIAHRLNTIMNCDRILVLNKGKVEEFDTPENLLKKVNGLFFNLAKDSGIVF